ncbi:AimR family lysis-lysogeny pheromone receptor [Gottfriedia sp. S16(2024)]|uniref:AimR family lysis-lysogeny pheromone receptor n=1 Tax=Gottfriedia sp. S16(2024) TaxID=3162883 RepID=UPI003D1E91AB
MILVATEIEETLDILETKITWQDIAKAAGLTKGALSHFKNGSEMKFPALLKIARFIYNNDYISKFKRWCLRFNQPKNVCYALDYLAVNRQVDELDELIDKVNKERQSDQKLIEWAKGYSILSSYLKGNNPEEVLNQLRSFSPKTIEMKILSLNTEFWCRNKMREYSIMASLIKGLDITINEIEDTYIRESYTMQLKDCLAFVNLYKFNNIELARKYANEIISSDFSATFTANAAYLLGMSYLFEDYDLCLGNILRYRGLLEETGRLAELKVVDENDIPFIKNIWNKHSQQPETNDISEKAHYEAITGNNELALELINKAIDESGVSGFKLYYKALATGDKTLFMQSLIFFISKKGDKFFANLPYSHLKDDPEYTQMANLLFND